MWIIANARLSRATTAKDCVWTALSSLEKICFSVSTSNVILNSNKWILWLVFIFTKVQWCHSTNLLDWFSFNLNLLEFSEWRMRIVKEKLCQTTFGDNMNNLSLLRQIVNYWVRFPNWMVWLIYNNIWLYLFWCNNLWLFLTNVKVCFKKFSSWKLLSYFHLLLCTQIKYNNLSEIWRKHPFSDCEVYFMW